MSSKNKVAQNARVSKGGWLAPSIVVLALLAATSVFWIYQNQQDNRVQNTIALHQTVKQYLSLHTTDTWLLTESPQVASAELISLTPQLTKKVRESFRVYRNLSPETRKITEAFSAFRVSYSTGGSSMQIEQSDPTKMLSEPLGMEICFFTKQERPNLPTALFYRKEWKAMMVAAIPWPDGVFAAELFHELGHALADKEGRTSASASADSDEWVMEEIEMHSLEGEVLNASTGSRYFAKLDAIL